MLALKYYDEAGRVLPSAGLYWCLLYMCRSYLVFIAALSFRQDSSSLLAIFYPDKGYLYTSLFCAIPTLLVLLVMSFREKVRHKEHCWLFTLIKPLMLATLAADIAFHLAIANKQYWGFSWLIALTLLVDMLCLYFVGKDRHLSFMLKDWAKPAVSEKEKPAASEKNSPSVNESGKP